MLVHELAVVARFATHPGGYVWRRSRVGTRSRLSRRRAERVVLSLLPCRRGLLQRGVRYQSA
jgi:hypothetical protein